MQHIWPLAEEEGLDPLGDALNIIYRGVDRKQPDFICFQIPCPW